MVRVHVPEPNFLRTNSLLGDEILESHFAIVQQDNSDENETERPETGHCVSRLIFGRKAKLQPARPSRSHGENRERDVA